ncbi:PEP-CTERM sorting domain-containing protein [Planctomycetota bacterium]
MNDLHYFYSKLHAVAYSDSLSEIKYTKQCALIQIAYIPEPSTLLLLSLGAWGRKSFKF